MPIYSSDSDDQPATTSRLFGRQRSLHQILGGGKVADILLWRKKNISAAVLIGSTIIWFLFEVAEYNFVSLLCHISIISMIFLFIWYSGAGFANWSPPDIHRIRIPESTLRWLLDKIDWFLFKFYEISTGKDFRQFFLAVVSLWILSVIGNYFSSLNLLYLGVVCMETLPALYERYEAEVDHLATRGNRDAKKLYKKFDLKVLNKIPRGPVKEKRFR
ncbi:hypothetical protein LguiA_031629 [Lonicera macranthoides]